MPRIRKPLELIEDARLRQIVLAKRMSALFKQARDFSVLCGVQVAIIIYSPDQPNVTAWPSYEDAQIMVERFVRESAVTRSYKMTSHEEYLNQMVTRENGNKHKNIKRNDEKELQEMMNQIFEGKSVDEFFDILQLHNLSLMAGEKMKKIEGRANPSLSLAHPAALPPDLRIVDHDHVENRSSIPKPMLHLMGEHWFMDTAAFHQVFAGPSQVRLMEFPPQHVAGTSGPKYDEELPEDLNSVFPNIYSP